MSKSKFYLRTGPVLFEVTSNIESVRRYLASHYLDFSDSPGEQFIDYRISVTHGPLYRRLLSPQAVFKVNHRQPFKPLPLDQAPAMLEWGMNWCITTSAHQYMIIHAATVEIDGHGVIICAPPGSGKSTLCAYLASQGWRLLSDELALLSLSDGMLYGLARPINLKNSSIDLMKAFYQDDDFSDEAKDTHKGTVCLVKPPKESVLQVQTPVSPALMVFVSYQADEHCYVEPVSKSQALIEIIKNTFNFAPLAGKAFCAARQLVQQTEAVYVEYNNFASCEKAIRSCITNCPK
ncbi:HPr kinase [Neiella marina]|uniref:HPr kinase n=1 Tax=Neiella marina TaxID=508461 RepID=A0A8J2XQE1_9GAMM|nr:HprK-related kinase A [Neiella marina]GGA84538.1 HPr kinase [Neiella marina]